MSIENYNAVGTVLENGDTVFHVTDTEYWVVAPAALWRKCSWDEAVEHCAVHGYILPTLEQVEEACAAVHFHHDCCWSSTKHTKGYAYAMLLEEGGGHGVCDKASAHWTFPIRRIAYLYTGDKGE